MYVLGLVNVWTTTPLVTLSLVPIHDGSIMSVYFKVRMAVITRPSRCMHEHLRQFADRAVAAGVTVADVEATLEQQLRHEISEHR